MRVWFVTSKTSVIFSEDNYIIRVHAHLKVSLRCRCIHHELQGKSERLDFMYSGLNHALPLCETNSLIECTVWSTHTGYSGIKEGQFFPFISLLIIEKRDVIVQSPKHLFGLPLSIMWKRTTVKNFFLKKNHMKLHVMILMIGWIGEYYLIWGCEWIYSNHSDYSRNCTINDTIH